MKEEEEHTTFVAAAGHAVRRWSVQRKEDVVMQLLQSVSLDEDSRKLGVPHYPLEERRNIAQHGMREALQECGKAIPWRRNWRVPNSKSVNWR